MEDQETVVLERIPPQMKVRRISDGKEGVTTPDLHGAFSVCSEAGTPVAFQGVEGIEETLTSDLEVLGPENAVPDEFKCGMGRASECCRYLVMNCESGKFDCQRHGSLRFSIIFSGPNMTAKRDPTEPYPDCMIFPPDDREKETEGEGS